MENINEIDLEIIKEFTNLPADAVNQHLGTVIENGMTVTYLDSGIVPPENAGIKDGDVGVDIECTGGINGHVIYLSSYTNCEKLIMLKNRSDYNKVSDDDKYEFVLDGIRELVKDIALNLANAYRMLIGCDIGIENVEAFTVPRASEFYAQSFETGEHVVVINGILNSSGGQNIEFKKLVSSELAKNIVDIFYNTDMKLPGNMNTLGESVSEGADAVSDSFSAGGDSMSDYINDELESMMPDNSQNFSENVAPIVYPQTAEETPISDRVEHIAAPNGGNLDLIMSVPVEVAVEVGRTKKRIKEILDFKKGTLVELNRVAGEPMDIYVNGKCIAKGEVVVIEDKFGVRVTKIMKTNNIFD